MALLLAYLSKSEVSLLGDVDAWRIRAVDILGYDPADVKLYENLQSDRDFLRQMATIGRPDISTRFLIDRMATTRGTSHEVAYLRKLGAFARDLCSIISFRMSASNGWVRRNTQGYSSLLDFLDSTNAEGVLIQRGEVVVSDGNIVPYTALNPEEDCSILAVVHGSVSDQVEPELLNLFSPNELKRADIISNFEDWVKDSMTRDDPAPSIVPYLKLIWFEWFSQAFEALKAPDFSVTKFRYQSLDVSKLVTPDIVRDLAMHPAATSWQKHLIALFLDLRHSLETTYR